jgi:hypothetical protein
MTHISRKKNISFFAALVIVFAVLLFQLANQKPYYNWDIIPYIAIALNYQSDDIEFVHKETYRHLQKSVNDQTYKQLTINGTYRSQIAQNPHFLAEQLPFYAVKPGYPWLIAALSILNVPPVEASVIISRIFYALTMLLIFSWLRLTCGDIPSAIITSLLFSTPFLTSLARLSTPDAIALFLISLSFCLILQMEKIKIGLSFLLIAIFFRPDTMLLLVLVCISYTFASVGKTKGLLVFAAAGLGVYLVISYIAGSYSISTLLAHSQNPMFEPSKYISSWGFSDYISYYWIYFRHAVLYTYLSYYFLGFVVIAFLAAKSHNDKILAVASATLVFMCCHWIAHPMEKERTLAFTFLLFIPLTLEVFHTYTGEKKLPLALPNEDKPV